MKKTRNILSYLSFTVITLIALMFAGCGDKPEPKSQVVGAPSSPVQLASADLLGPRYEATLVEGIDFKKPGYPNFVAKVEGMSGYEPWGRWSQANLVTIKFKQPLPSKFVLVIVGGAYGPNIGKPIKVKAGTVMKEIVFTSDPFKQPNTHRIDFQLDAPVDTIEFSVPQPTQPPSGDLRKLGIGLTALKIEG
jgi:hypothetical protein